MNFTSVVQKYSSCGIAAHYCILNSTSAEYAWNSLSRETLVFHYVSANIHMWHVIVMSLCKDKLMKTILP